MHGQVLLLPAHSMAGCSLTTGTIHSEPGQGDDDGEEEKFNSQVAPPGPSGGVGCGVCV